MTRAAIGLGSNLGDRLDSFRFAAEALAELGVVVSVSSLYETAPIGGPAQDAFFNAVLVLDTDLDPRQLLDELHRIEAEAGRLREVRWGPRRLDLDLILYGNQRAEGGGMVVPHPRFPERRFVLDPLVEIWPEAETPDGRRVGEFLPGVADQEVARLGSWWPESNESDASVVGTGNSGGLSAPASAESSTGSTFAARGGWWVIAQVVLGAAVLVCAFAFAETISAGRWLRWVGVGLVGAGGVQVGFGLLHLGVSLTPYPEPLELGNLVHGGVYRHVRHPVYGGISLGMIGLGLYQSSWAGLIAAISASAFFWFKAGFEEHRLLAKYPGYADYRARTRARLLPWII
jgi:2-amino-4-hydroxy-6-hydroxymethyldihydropteridine diphosphokinase